MPNQKTGIEFHLHPNFQAYSLEKILDRMDKNKLDIMCLSYLDKSISGDLDSQYAYLKDMGFKIEADSKTVKIERRSDSHPFYIIPSVEVNTADSFHLLCIGSDEVPQKPLPLRGMIEYSIRNEALVIFDHPFVNIKKMYWRITKAKEKGMESVCREFSGNLALEWNGYCKSSYWDLTKFIGNTNVNDAVIQLSEKLRQEGYNVPVISDTDLHAKSEDALKAIGTARIQIDKLKLDFASGMGLIRSIKQNIFSGEYINSYETISWPHFINFFAIPYIREHILKKRKN